MEPTHLFRLAANACGTKTGLLPSLYDGLQCKNGPTPDLTTMSDILIVGGNVMRILIMAAGALTVIAIILSGIFYIASTGDAGRVKRAKDILVNAMVGLVVILISYSLVTFIAKGF